MLDYIGNPQLDTKMVGYPDSFNHPKDSQRFCRLGVVACSCNLATWRRRLVDGLRSGFLPGVVLCRSGVRAKPGINMVSLGEPEVTRLSKEGRTGPGRKRSRQKSPCWAVAGSRL